MHARSQNTNFFMHLILPNLLNDSQTIHFSKPLLCVTLICSDWSISFQCYFVYSVTVETDISNATKVAPSGNKWAGNMLMIHVDVKQGLVLKTTRFNDSESTLFLLRDDNFQI